MCCISVSVNYGLDVKNEREKFQESNACECGGITQPFHENFTFLGTTMLHTAESESHAPSPSTNESIWLGNVFRLRLIMMIAKFTNSSS